MAHNAEATATCAAPVDSLLPSLEREMRIPLAALAAASEMLVEELGAGHPGSGFARLIHREAGRVQDSMTDLTGLALPLPGEPRLIDLAPILAELLHEVAGPARNSGVEVSANIAAHPVIAWGDVAGLRTALGRIVRYELDSMSGGGRLAIRVGWPAGGREVLIFFSDTGPHLPIELLAKVFDPFVTAAGRRSGMGLAHCRRIIEHAGGAVAARNDPKGGLVIEVRLVSGDGKGR